MFALRILSATCLVSLLAGSAIAQAPNSFDQAQQLLSEAKVSFGRVKDYSGVLVKEEKINGQLLPEQYIEFKIRPEPFSVALKWNAPKALQGQEAMYVMGRNENRLKAKSAGFAAIAGFISLDLRDPRITSQNRHTITETGIGYLIDSTMKNLENDRRFPANVVQVKFADYAFQGKPHLCMETTHSVNNGQFPYYRTLVFFDKDLRMPVRFEGYDWPVQGGNPKGEKLEVYSYINLKFNTGVTDATFGY